MPSPADTSITSTVVAFGDALRSEGVAIGTSELLDAFAALEQVSWTDPDEFREALAATLAKSQHDHRIFELVFARFFFRAAEAAALSKEGEADRAIDSSEAGRLDIDELRQAVADAIASGDEAAMMDLARLAVASFGHRSDGSGVLGVDLQRIRRELELRGERREGGEGRGRLPIDQVRRFEEMLRRELERIRIGRDGELPPARPLNDLDRALPTGPTQDLAAVHRVVAQLRRQLKTHGHDSRGHKRHAAVDMRSTMRASLQYGGVPLVIKQKPVRPRRPEIFVLCDVSTSVTSASVFFLSVLHALHDSFRRMRSFVFIERVSEVTQIFETERDFRAVSERIGGDAGVADVSGYTDYGRVWAEFLGQVEDDLHPRATVIVLGDARTNGRPAGTAAFEAITASAGRTFWLNPEPRLYWNYGDSVIADYERYCSVFECWTTPQLEAFVKALTATTRS